MDPFWGDGPLTWALFMHVKTKELGPVGGGVRRKNLYVDPPMSELVI